jgi:predicted DNA-binding mobile mystery protein A
MKNKQLQLKHLESRVKLFAPAIDFPNPSAGWIRALRQALGMTMQQLANKLSISKQSVSELETREKEGSLTLSKLRETAAAMDMHLVYGFVPREKSLEDYIEKKARELAEQIISRTSNTMKLEDQENSKQRIEKAIEERTEMIKRELPKNLWD